MTDATVTVNNQNQNQGAFDDVERKALFIGVGTKGMGRVLSLNTQSDLDDLLGSEASVIRTVIGAAKLNGGQNWFAQAVALESAGDWSDSIDEAIETVDPELLVFCDVASDKAAINAIKDKVESFLTTHAKRCQALIAVRSINTDEEAGETWSGYEAAMIALQDGLEAERVFLVPQLHENTDIGILAGRLCRHEQSIADSPQRTKTGSIFGLGAAPVDKDGKPLRDATLANLRANRMNCVKRYVGKDGTYFGNYNSLAGQASDFQNGEWLRLADKAARRVRILAIGMIDDRAINSGKTSQDHTTRVLRRPLVEMSDSVIVSGVPFPGEIEPPAADAVTINWKAKTSVEFFVKVQPLDSPKTLVANILLDLSAPE